MENHQDIVKLFDTGWDCYEAGNKTKAFALWKDAAEFGFAKAQHFVGFCCYRGYYYNNLFKLRR